MLKKVMVIMVLVVFLFSVSNLCFADSKIITVSSNGSVITLNSNWTTEKVYVCWKKFNDTQINQWFYFGSNQTIFTIPDGVYAVKVITDAHISTLLPVLSNNWLQVRERPTEIWTNFSHSTRHTTNKGHQIYQKSNWGHTRWIDAYEPDAKCQICYPPTTYPKTDMTDNSKMWTVSNGTMIWSGEQNGKYDILQSGDWLTYIQKGNSATFTTTVPGKVSISVGQISGKDLNTLICNGATTISLSAGTYTVSNSSGSNGGFRWAPAPGYGYNK